MKNHTRMVLKEVVKVSIEQCDPGKTVKNKFTSCVNAKKPIMEYLAMDNVFSVVNCDEHSLPAIIILHKPKYFYEVKTGITYVVQDLL